MTINWYGQSCFRLNTQKNREASVNILFDPPSKESGLRGPKLEADILLISSENKLGDGNYFLIEGPGEYDVKGIYVEGIPSQSKAKKNTIYTIEAEGIKICHLGKLSQEELTSEQLEKIGDVDILIIPIGGGEVIEAKEAIKIMAQIEPKIIIPMYYRIPELKVHPVKLPSAGFNGAEAKLFNRVKLDTLDKFLKALGIKKLEPLPKLSVKKKDISSEEAKIIILEA